MQRPPTCACACGAPPAQQLRPPPPGAAPAAASQQQQQQRHRPPRPPPPRRARAPARGAAAAALPPGVEALFGVAAADPAAIQDLIVGGAVTAAVGAALFSGLRKDPVPCELCMGTGGIKCFACDGDGAGASRDGLGSDAPAAARRPRRDPVGRTPSGRACRVCGGGGLVLCSRCRGSGYVTPGL
ncbi:disulfide-isomerase-like [Raphidocelis subcapitata]|uniref:Disulfide-isomerase-like n=1 Tax=Raphidocelis subcapitata TaxID=307507 RepID=A0A2V0P5C3_9CHLO|nr:disulfide-isomerase-like [Raphidocelis subcapitata]|eukprot:GBF92377.1 disulfide-isomerase-like [Raphidocelis subcapitata]